MTRAQGLTELDAIMRAIDKALDLKDFDLRKAQRDFQLLCFKRRALLRWLAK